MADEALAFLSEAWFERARDLTADLPGQPGVGCRLQYEAVDGDGSSLRWHHVIVDGRVEAFGPGELTDPDLELRWPLATAQALYAGDASGTEAMAALTVAHRSESQVVTGPPSPADITMTGGLDHLPRIPEATLTTQFRLVAGPFGPVDFWWTFEDGISTGMGFGVVAEHDVWVQIRYQRMVAVRRGEISVVEALEEGGKVDGGVGPLMLLAGLQESPELLAAGKACGPSGPVLADLGRVTSGREHRQAMADLAAVTG